MWRLMSLDACSTLYSRDLDWASVMCFNQDDAILLNDKSLKLVDQFIYLDSNIMSIENNVNICIGKTWTTIDQLMTIWKSDLSNKIGILSNCSHVSTTVWLHYLNSHKAIGKKLNEKYTRMLHSFQQILETAL